MLAGQDMSKEEILKYIDQCLLRVSKHVEPTGIMVHESVIEILQIEEHKGLTINSSPFIEEDYIYITTNKPDNL